jgi:RHS repeat-associated protein
MGTSKGFSGQYTDAFSGLDYYDSRYHEPAVGVFLSADSKEGNTLGMDPYMYVGGNPETYNDPTGEYYAPPPQGNGNPPPTCVQLNNCQPVGGGNSPSPSTPSSSSGGTRYPKHLTPNQLDAWCLHDTKCVTDLFEYQLAQEQAADENSIMIFMTLFSAFEGDPEELQQMTEEDMLLWQQLAEEEGVTLDDAVSAKLVSDDPAQRVEGEAGAIASLYSKLIRFNYEYGPNGSLGEVDAETPDAIIEAKSGGIKNRIGGIIKQYTNTVTNPDRKPFVIYAPNWNANNVQTVSKALGSVDGPDLYIATSQEQLIEILVYLGSTS